jgi:ATP-dependent DNA helicase RecG
MDKLGLVRDIDLALHLPLRYEDETRIVRPCRRARRRQVQVEATRMPRRGHAAAASCWCAWPTAPASLLLRFLNFYPSQQKALARGPRVRARGEVRGGFFGREMVHPDVASVPARRRCRRR